MDNLSKENIDYQVLILIFLILFTGVVSIYSATYDAGASTVYYRQLIWVGVGLVAMVSFSLLPFRTLQLLSYPLYILSIISLIVVLLLGKQVAGSTSWFGFRGFGIQPSEFAKATTILALASFLSHHNVNLTRLKDIFKAISIIVLPTMLIMAQPDMGTAIIYFGILLGTLYWAGIPFIFVLAMIAPVASALGALYGTTAFVIILAVTLLILLVLRENRIYAALVFSLTALIGVSVQFIFGKLHAYQQNRILTFFNPDIDPLGAGYNVIQSKIAIGSGGIFGKGYLKGTQTQLNFIPAQWTDFIFCVPAEEFGFIGGTIILILLFLLLSRGMKIAILAKSRFASIVAIGIVSAFLTHIMINIGMSMGIFPVIGVPLPFLSYGGSNIITNLIMGGLLMNIYANRKEY